MRSAAHLRFGKSTFSPPKTTPRGRPRTILSKCKIAQTGKRKETARITVGNRGENPEAENRSATWSEIARENVKHMTMLSVDRPLIPLEPSPLYPLRSPGRPAQDSGFGEGPQAGLCGNMMEIANIANISRSRTYRRISRRTKQLDLESGIVRIARWEVFR